MLQIQGLESTWKLRNEGGPGKSLKSRGKCLFGFGKILFWQWTAIGWTFVCITVNFRNIVIILITYLRIMDFSVKQILYYTFDFILAVL